MPGDGGGRPVTIELWKDSDLSRTDATPLSPGLTRISFAKIREPLAVPDLLALQTASFDWLLGGRSGRPGSPPTRPSATRSRTTPD